MSLNTTPDRNLRTILPGIIRTIVPAVAAVVIAQLARVGLNLDPNQITEILEIVIMGVYYTLIRVLEARFPWVGILLGWAVQPVYDLSEPKAAPLPLFPPGR